MQAKQTVMNLKNNLFFQVLIDQLFDDKANWTKKPPLKMWNW